MLLEQENRAMESSGVQQVARATIKTSPKIFNFFADQTYANKPVAICRELVANAHDSHVMAGKADLPVQVWLPTLIDATFKVRDQGLGMAHEFMMNEFMCYADGSTKDQSNIAIGGFGIGSKSPFAYVDQYSVRSIFDGTESVYSVFKDAEGIPSIGLLGQRPTTEPNGVEVSFPVQPDDFSRFEKAAFEALRHFDPLPEIKNAVSGAFEAPSYVAAGKTWGMRPSSGPLQIIMGGVMYPVSTSNLSYRFPDDSAAYKLLDYGLDLRVPIGTCSVALSREALSYDDRTIEAIRTACDAVVEEVKASFATMFDHLPTEWEAAAALYKEINGVRGGRATFLAENAFYKGQPLSTFCQFPAGEYEVWKIDARRDRTSRRGKVAGIGNAKFEMLTNFTPGEVEALVFDDLPQKPGSKVTLKIREFCEGVQGQVLVIRPCHEKFSIDVFNAPADLIYRTSDMPEPIMKRRVLSGGRMIDRPKVRMFLYDGRQQRHDWRSPSLRISPERDGVHELSEAHDTGILVVMENFIPPADVKDKVSSGLLSWDELRFVNRADAKKLPKDRWQSYTDVWTQRKKEALAQYPELAQRLALSNCDELAKIFAFFRQNPTVDFTSRKPFGQIFNLYQRYVKPLDDNQRLLARFVVAKLPSGVKPELLREKFNTKQPKARRLLQLFPDYRSLSDEDLRLLQENL